MEAARFFTIDTENAFHKVQYLFIRKTLKKLGIEGTIFNIIKAGIGILVLYDSTMSPRADIMLR